MINLALTMALNDSTVLPAASPGSILVSYMVLSAHQE